MTLEETDAVILRLEPPTENDPEHSTLIVHGATDIVVACFALVAGMIGATADDLVDDDEIDVDSENDEDLSATA